MPAPAVVGGILEEMPDRARKRRRAEEPTMAPHDAEP
jgi:hypothetical protein